MALPPVIPSSNIEFINKRPSNPRYFRDEINRTPDLLMEWVEGNTKKYYSCWRKLKKNDENCWKIMLTTVSANIDIDLIDPYGLPAIATGDVTQILYPYGCDGYNFTPFHILNYDWQYKY